MLNASAFAAQAGLETRQLVRRWDVIFFSIVVPVAVMFFFGSLYSGPSTGGAASTMTDRLPGYIVMSVMSVGLATLGFMLSTERQFGILKRLGITPLSRTTLLLSKASAAMLIVGIATGILVGIGIFNYNVQMRGDIVSTAFVITSGVLVFSLMGLMMAGMMKADATAAATNAVYLLMMVLGGTLFPLSGMPSVVQQVAQVTPSYHFMAALTDVMIHGSSLLDVAG